MPKSEFLVVDTSAFIKNVHLQDLAINLITCPDVVNEIKCSRVLRRLVVLPYDLKVEEPDSEDVIFVTQFAKKTGDYAALSATDIKVIALTYKYERLKIGKEHLNSSPPAPKEVLAIDHSLINDKNLVGFYSPDTAEDGEENDNLDYEGSEDTETALDRDCKDDEDAESSDEFEDPEDSQWSEDRFLDAEQEVPEVNEDELVLRLSGIKVEEGDKVVCDQNDPCAVDSDDAGWITPSNLKKINRSMGGGEIEEDNSPITVACLTTDFAMQNVLKQIGLKIVTLDGMLIKQVRTWILRCYACFRTTPDVSRIFCHHCGNKTLKRVAITVDPDGKEHLHINFRRPLTARGKRFPLPAPRGGKHSNNPVLSEDQRVPQQRPSRLATKKTDALNPDYIAGVSPFIMRDVNSKSAMLGIPNKTQKSWERKNPNVVVKRRRKK